MEDLQLFKWRMMQVDHRHTKLLHAYKISMLYFSFFWKRIEELKCRAQCGNLT